MNIKEPKGAWKHQVHKEDLFVYSAIQVQSWVQRIRLLKNVMLKAEYDGSFYASAWLG